MAYDENFIKMRGGKKKTIVPSVSSYYTYGKILYKIRAIFWQFCNSEQFLANNNIFLQLFAQIVIAGLVPKPLNHIAHLPCLGVGSPHSKI
jgi:hypothetical protein